MKSFTDIEQSRKLAEILPLESADMCWITIDDEESFDGNWEVVPRNSSLIAVEDKPLFCWSLAALLDVVNIGNFVTLYYDYNAWHLKVYTSGNASDNRISYCVIYADSPIDACVEMILKLHNFDIM